MSHRQGSKPWSVPKVAAWLIRARWWVLPTSLILVMLLSYGAKNLVVNDNYRYFFREGNPQVIAFDALKQTYSKNDNILFVLAPKSGQAFDAATLAAVEQLTKEAWQIPFATRVDSITNFQHTYAEGDDLIVLDLVEHAQDQPIERLNQARAIALNEPLLRRRIIDDTAAITGVNVTVELPGKQVGEQVPAVAHARELIIRMRADHPDIDFYLSGFVMLNNAFQESSILDMKTLVPLMYGVILIFMTLLLRSFSATIATLVMIAATVASAMGVSGWLGIQLSSPSAIAPTLIMTLAVADSVHILVSMLQFMRRGQPKIKALKESLRVNVQPVFLTSLTTIIGFLSLNFSDVQPINDLGNITAIGVALAFILSVTLLPVLMAVLPVHVRPLPERVSPMQRLADFVIARRRPILWGSTAIILGFSVFIFNNRLDDRFVQYFDPSLAFRSDTDFTTQNLTGIYQLEFSLESGQEGGISEPDYLARIDAFAEWYRAKDEVVHVDVFSDTMKRLNKNMHGDDPAWYRLPERRDLAAQYLLLYEMSLPFGLDLNNRINVSKSSSRFIVTLKDIPTGRIRVLAEAGEAWLRDHTPASMHAHAAGPPVMFSYLSYRNSVGMFIGTVLAFLLITLTLIIFLRSLRFGLLTLIPNLVPSLIAFGVWGILDGEINFGLTIVSALSIGIVVDDTVHFLSKFLRAQRELGLPAEAAVRYAFDNVGRALIVTTSVLTAGFLILVFSKFQMNEGMGKLTALTLVTALIADFFMLPALLLTLGRERDRKRKAVQQPIAPPSEGLQST